MINGTDFRELVSGRKRGFGAWAARTAFAAAEVPYALAVRWRNRGYELGKRETVCVDVPVISVGNLTLGGTGKTPMVEWIARRLRGRGVRVSLVSRGYGADDQGHNDEALELELALPDVPHVQNPDRVAAATVAIEELATQLVVMDDGFQHRRLGRDLDIVLLDATEPFGFGRVFPRGTLREPASGLRRADVVVLSRAEMLEEEGRSQVRQRVAGLAPRAAWCEAAHRPACLVNADGERRGFEELAGKRVAAFCGIGNPAGFRYTLDGLPLEIADWREFPDHHSYTAEEVLGLARGASEAGAGALVCTRKDLVKIAAADIEGMPVWAVEVRLEVLAGEESLAAAIDGAAERALAVDEPGASAAP
ncbi:MAG: tetraacyldisaccharide 4'-kinase [Planctomycetota bacterium]